MRCAFLSTTQSPPTYFGSPENIEIPADLQQLHTEDTDGTQALVMRDLTADGNR